MPDFVGTRENLPIACGAGGGGWRGWGVGVGWVGGGGVQVKMD